MNEDEDGDDDDEFVNEKFGVFSSCSSGKNTKRKPIPQLSLLLPVVLLAFLFVLFTFIPIDITGISLSHTHSSFFLSLDFSLFLFPSFFLSSSKEKESLLAFASLIFNQNFPILIPTKQSESRVHTLSSLFFKTVFQYSIN